MRQVFHLITAVVFAAVALLHMLRLEFDANVVVAGAWIVPMWVSWPGMIVAALLSVWAFRLWDLDRRKSRA